MNHNFPRYRICTGKQLIVKDFRFRLPLERMTKFSKNCKKTFHYFRTKIFFSRKSTSTSSSFLDFCHCTKFQHNLMNRFSEKLFTDKWMEEWIDSQDHPSEGFKIYLFMDDFLISCILQDFLYQSKLIFQLGVLIPITK